MKKLKNIFNAYNYIIRVHVRTLLLIFYLGGDYL